MNCKNFESFLRNVVCACGHFWLCQISIKWLTTCNTLEVWTQIKQNNFETGTKFQNNCFHVVSNWICTKNPFSNIDQVATCSCWTWCARLCKKSQLECSSTTSEAKRDTLRHLLLRHFKHAHSRKLSYLSRSLRIFLIHNVQASA